MRILVDLNHPGHVHLFKNAIKEWQSRGDKVLITARDKDVSLKLLKNLGFDFRMSAPVRHGVLALPLAVLELDWSILRTAQQFDPDFLIGTSFSIAHVSKLVRGKSIVFGEDSMDASRIFWRITIPFADHIVTPDTLLDDFGPRHITYPGCHELAYLHPNRFKPDPSVLSEQDLEPNEPFSIMRFVALRASHDLGQKGLNEAKAIELFQLLAEKGRVIISSEGNLPPELQPYQMSIAPEKLHDLLAHAQILVSDSQTTTVEAAMLGVPSVRLTTFVGRTPVIEELEFKYKLTFGFLPGQEGEFLKKAKEILSGGNNAQIWQHRREKMLHEKIDLTEWMIELIDNLKEQ